MAVDIWMQTLISSCEMETINNEMNKNQSVSLIHDPPPLPTQEVGQFTLQEPVAVTFFTAIIYAIIL